MKIAVVSGKGGTGKTTVAVSLAKSIAADLMSLPCYESQYQSSIRNGGPSDPLVLPLFLDCDVEAPNAHLFLKPVIEAQQDAGIPVPTIDENRCTLCGTCVEVCQYNAIALVAEQVLVFPELCHGCGSCTLNCPESAITETMNVIGVLERGITAEGMMFAHGVLNIGEPMAVPVILQLKQFVKPESRQIVIMDSPPGTSCPLVAVLHGAEFALLVTEPTPFGLHDLKLAIEVVKNLSIPFGIVINRDGIGDACVECYCADEKLPVFMRIPFDRTFAEGIARGQALTDIHPEYISQFQRMFAKIVSIVDKL